MLGSNAVEQPTYDVLSPKLNHDEGCGAYLRVVNPESLAHLRQHFCASNRSLRASHDRCGYGEPNTAAEVEGGLAIHRHRVPASLWNLGVSTFRNASGIGAADSRQHPVPDRNVATRPPYRGDPFNAFDHERAEFHPGITGTAIERGRSLCTV